MPDRCRASSKLNFAGPTYYTKDKYFKDSGGNYYNSYGAGFEKNIKPLLEVIDLGGVDQFSELILRCYLQLCSDVVLGYAQYEHIQPVLSRAKSSIVALRNAMEVVDVPTPAHLQHVISFKKCKNEIKKICRCSSPRTSTLITRILRI